MFVTFLDQINHQKIEKDIMIQRFNQIEYKDLEYSNSGYFSVEIPNQGWIVLFFWFVDPARMILRYDKNIPTPQQGESWLSYNRENNLALFDIGDDTWLPFTAIIPLQTAIDSIAKFYDEPLSLPNIIQWQNVDEVVWND